MKAVIAMETLQGVLKALSAIDTEGKMQVGPEGWHVKMVDPANVAMIDVTIPASAFDFYQSDTGEIALDFARIQTMLNGKEPVTIQIVDQQVEISTGRHKFSLRLLDPSAVKPTPRIPEIDLPAAVEIDATEWTAALKAALAIMNKSDCVIIEQTDEMFRLSAKSEAESYVSEWPLTSLTGIKNGMGRALFTLDYLTDISRALAGPVKIETGVDYPMRMSCRISKASVSYLIAPRIENDL